MMANSPGAASIAAAHPHETLQPAENLRFDGPFAALSLLFVGGLYLDGWAHTHGQVDDSFFTPWHAVFYAGFFALLGFLGLTVFQNRSGDVRRHALPTGYRASLAGAGVFFAGGVGDMIWHTLFGVESDVEALISPTHLALALGMFLIVGGPLRAALHRPRSEAHGWAMLGPAVVSLTLMLVLLTFFLGYGHPFADPWPSAATLQRHPVGDPIIASVVGVAGILLQTVLLISVILFAIRRWTLPPGALTLLIMVNAALATITHDEYRLIPAAVAGGLAAELLYWGLKPSAEQGPRLRAFAFAVPVVFYLAYFVWLIILGDNSWSVHLWTGSVVLAGAAGLLLSYGFVPPDPAAPPS